MKNKTKLAKILPRQKICNFNFMVCCCCYIFGAERNQPPTVPNKHLRNVLISGTNFFLRVTSCAPDAIVLKKGFFFRLKLPTAKEENLIKNIYFSTFLSTDATEQSAQAADKE
jgi:hypothetical protein